MPGNSIRAKTYKIKQFKKIGQPLLSITYFLENGLSQLTLANYGSYYFYLWFSSFLYFVLTLLWIDWERMKIVNMSQSCRGNFLTFFWFSVLRKPIGSQWFKKVLLKLFSLLFFIKWWNSTKPFFFYMSKQHFCQTFLLIKIQQKYIWSTEMYLYGFCQTVWLLTGIPINFIYTSFLKKIICI